LNRAFRWAATTRLLYPRVRNRMGTLRVSSLFYSYFLLFFWCRVVLLVACWTANPELRGSNLQQGRNLSRFLPHLRPLATQLWWVHWLCTVCGRMRWQGRGYWPPTLFFILMTVIQDWLRRLLFTFYMFGIFHRGQLITCVSCRVGKDALSYFVSLQSDSHRDAWSSLILLFLTKILKLNNEKASIFIHNSFSSAPELEGLWGALYKYLNTIPYQGAEPTAICSFRCKVNQCHRYVLLIVTCLFWHYLSEGVLEI